MSAPTPGYWTPMTAPRYGGTPGRAPANTFAWVGLIVSVSGFIVPLGINGLVGAAFSLVGLRDARKLAAEGHTETGRQLAIAGLVTGIVHVAVTIGVIALAYFAWVWFVTWLENLPAELVVS